jgi:hypothetical protein
MLRPSRRALGLLVATLAIACRRDPGGAAQASGSATPSASASAAVAPEPSQGKNAVAAKAPEGRPLLGITAFSVIVYAEPRDTAKRLGYLRLGAKVPRAEEPSGKAGCPGGWFEIFPRGFVCAGPEATTDMASPVLAAASRRPDLAAALPYRYGFVRAVLPLYLRVPSKADQEKAEFKLEEHLAWYRDNKAEVDRVKLGAWDVPLDDRGVPIPDKRLGEIGTGKNSQEVGLGVLFGGATDDDPIPDWLAGGKRAIPNVSDFAVPEYAVFADRARRFTGLGLVGSFTASDGDHRRRFAVTTDLRLAPTTKLKPDTGSPFHGVELGERIDLPLAFVREPGASAYSIDGNAATRDGDAAFRTAIALSGKQKKVAGERYVQAKDGRWLKSSDLSVIVPPRTFPAVADAGEKWIEVSLGQQALTLWEGKRAVYATMVSSGRKEFPTLTGEFRIQNKHITATMDSDESSSVGGSVARAPEPEGGGRARAESKPEPKKDKAAPKKGPKRDGKPGG